ncbi:MAG: hypothetical protein VZR00_00055 [Lachnospiraceae bacterium]|nr:hypothetical protein [Lachnospiraceae bacterium]MEE3460274.1 hypothetical protein [Lachnospiraceae bacterium]
MQIAGKLLFTALMTGMSGIPVFFAALLVFFFLSRMGWKWKAPALQIFFLRLLVPVGVFSPFAISRQLNIRVHVFLADLGPEEILAKGTLFGSFDILRRDIRFDNTFCIAGLIWAAGAIIFFIYLMNVGKNAEEQKGKSVRSAGNNGLDKSHVNNYSTGKGDHFTGGKISPAGTRHLYDNVYEGDFSEPFVKGFIHKKIYVPAGLKAEELKAAVVTASAAYDPFKGPERLFIDLVSALQWFNPFCHIMRAEYWRLRKKNVPGSVSPAAGSAAVLLLLILAFYSFGLSYARQAIANGDFGERGRHLIGVNDLSQSISGAGNAGSDGIKGAEGMSGAASGDNIEAYQAAKNAPYGSGSASASSLSATQEAMAGLLKGGEDPVLDRSTMQEGTDILVSLVTTWLSNGDPAELKLIMSNGIYSVNDGYQGTFRLELYDTKTKRTYSYDLAALFSGDLYFSPHTDLKVFDYNEDGISEVSIGQYAPLSSLEIPAATSGSIRGVKTGDKVHKYYLLSIMNDGFIKASDGIVADQANLSQTGSAYFTTVPDAAGLFYTHFHGELIYYYWDNDRRRFINRRLTDTEINNMIYDPTGTDAGGKNTNKVHKLFDDSKDLAIRADTHADDEKGDIINKIVIRPDGIPRAFDNIHGYYCNLYWPTVGKGMDRYRYACLLYNGAHAQTFVIYDVKKKNIFYAQEDGNTMLNTIFKEFGDSGEGDGSFIAHGSACVYNLGQIISEHELNIRFAAVTGEGYDISGDFILNIDNGKTSRLTYRQVKAADDDQ